MTYGFCRDFSFTVMNKEKKLFEKRGQISNEMCTKIADGLRAEQQLACKVFSI